MTTSLDRRIRGLKVQKRSIITSFSAITSFVNNFEAERDRVEVPVRLENINALWTDYNKVQQELEILEDSEENLETLLKERMEVERAYYRTKGMLMTHHNRPSTDPPNQPRSQESSNNTSQIKLPDVKLPIFGGEFESWLNFHDMFMSLVHTSAHLSTIQKFYYLRSSLTGEALKLIQTIPISNEQYPVAWKMLEDHYSNPRRLQKAYIQSLFEFPSMKQESASALHSLIERFEANVRILSQLGEKTEHWDALLIHLLSSRLDPVTRRDWEVFAEANKATKFKKLVSFLQERVNVLQSVANQSTNPPSKPTAPKGTVTRSAYHGSTQRTPQQCMVCSNQHSLYQCATFSGMTMEEKQGFVRNNHLCWNCLRRGHSSRECNSESSCRQCGGRHHTLLCSASNPAPQCSSHPSIQADQSLHQGSENQVPPSTGVSYTGVASSGATTTTMLATAIINLVDDNGAEHAVRALLDSGSELSFATDRLRQRLKVRETQTALPIAGIGEAASEVRLKFQSTIRSRVTNYSTKIDFHVMPKVTVDLPTKSVDTSGWPLPTGLKLADPSFCTTGPIDVVLGAEVFFDLFEASGRISLGSSLPSLVNSKLGWIVSGKTPTANNATSANCNTATISQNHRNKASRIPLRREVQRHTEDLPHTSKEKATNDVNQYQQPNQQKSTIYGTNRRTSAAQGRTELLNNRFENFFATFQ